MLSQRFEGTITGLGSIKTTRTRVYSASNRQLALENGWPFRRFGGGSGSAPAAPPSPLDALSSISQSLTGAPPACPRTSALIRTRLIDINRQRDHTTAQQRRKTVEKPPEDAGKALLPGEAAQRHQQGQSPANHEQRELCQGVLDALRPVQSTCDQRAPVGLRAGGRWSADRWQQTAERQRADGPSSPQAGHRAGQGRARAGRARARGRHGTWRAPAARPAIA